MIKATSILGAQGEFTLPHAIREALNLRAGDEVEFVLLRDGSLIMLPLNAAPTAFFEAVPPRPSVFKDDEAALDALMAVRAGDGRQAAE